MPNKVLLALLLTTISACEATSEPEDGLDDSFLGPDGKADAFGVVEGSPDALGVLRLVNEASQSLLDDDVGLTSRVARNITRHRAGADEVDGTSDDDRFDTLTELDAVPRVGPAAFDRLLAYARASGYVPETPPDDDGGAALGFACGGAGTWSSILLDDPDFGITNRESTDLQLGRDGGLHVMVSDTGRTRGTFYAFRSPSSGAWEQARWVVPGSNDESGVNGSITLDPAGTPMISSTSYTGREDLAFSVQRPDGLWDTVTVDDPGRDYPVYSTSVVADAHGIDIAYQTGVFSSIKVAHADSLSGGWTLETLNPGDEDVTLRKDAHGGLYVVFRTPSPYSNPLTVQLQTKRPGGHWGVENIDGQPGNCAAMDVDSEGGVHVAYGTWTRPGQAVTYAYRAPGSTTWVKTLVAEDSGTTKRCMALAVDARNVPHLAFLGAGSVGVKYATPVDGAWQVSDVETRAARGVALRVDANGVPYVTYIVWDGESYTRGVVARRCR
jgi:hypothetical protein